MNQPMAGQHQTRPGVVSVVLGSVAGVFVDRWDRKRILVWSNLLQGGVVALLLLVPGQEWLWLVFADATSGQNC